MKIEELVSHSCSKEFIVLGDGISDGSSRPLKRSDSFPLLVASVVQVLDFVDADEPVLRRVGLFQSIQLEIFVPDLGVADSVK